MSHLNETDDRLRGCGEKREKKIKRQGRERTSRREESALGRGNRNTMSYRLFFFAVSRDMQNFYNQKSHLGPCIGSPVLTTGPLKKSQRHIDFCVHTYTPVHIHILISERKGDSQRKMDLGLLKSFLSPPTIDINGSNNI